jgi:DNA-binding NarL/FixJ family response regulator
VDEAAPTRVVVGEDHPIFREGVIRVLEGDGFEVVAATADARDVVRKTRAHHPDVVVVDIQMPPDRQDDGLRAALEIRASDPDVGVLVLSEFLEGRYALDLVGDRAEGVGYLLKDKVGDVAVFIDAVRRVAADGSAFDPDVVALLVARKRRTGPLETLTRRELEVLSLMAEGCSNAAVAERLVVTGTTVERHITSIFDKLGLQQSREQHRRVVAVLTYLQS